MRGTVREFNVRRPRRPGFTIIEIFITSLIMLVVLMVAYNFMTASMREARKATGLSEAVQAGAIILHSLQRDLANAIPSTLPGDTINREYDPSSREWTLTFTCRDVRVPFDFNSRWDGQEEANPGNAVYLASPITAAGGAPSGKPPIYRITRTFSPSVGPLPAIETKFSGAYAEAVRFETFKAGNASSGEEIFFVRVNMLLLGIPAELVDGKVYDPNAVQAADRPKPYLLTFLARIPTKPEAQ